MGSKRHVTRKVTPRRHTLPCRSWENPAWGWSVPGQARAVLFFPTLSFFSFFSSCSVSLLCVLVWSIGSWHLGSRDGCCRGLQPGEHSASVLCWSQSHARASPMLELVPVLLGIPRAAVPRHSWSHLTQYAILPTAGTGGLRERQRRDAVGCEPSLAAAPQSFIPTAAASERRCLQVYHLLVCVEV